MIIVAMESRHQVSNTLLSHLSSSIFVDEDGCCSRLPFMADNLLTWIWCLMLIIWRPGIRGILMTLFLLNRSFTWENRRSFIKIWSLWDCDRVIRLIPNPCIFHHALQRVLLLQGLGRYRELPPPRWELIHQVNLIYEGDWSMALGLND